MGLDTPAVEKKKVVKKVVKKKVVKKTVTSSDSTENGGVAMDDVNGVAVTNGNNVEVKIETETIVIESGGDGGDGGVDGMISAEVGEQMQLEVSESEVTSSKVDRKLEIKKKPPPTNDPSDIETYSVEKREVEEGQQKVGLEILGRV